MTAICHSISLDGLEPAPVLVEVDVARGVPSFTIVGLGDTAVHEARERVGRAIRNAGYAFPLTRKTVNLAPSGTRKTGSHYDLAIAIGLLAASGSSPVPSPDTVIVGELGLDGSIRAIRGALPLVLGARALGYKRVIVPAENGGEAGLATGISVEVSSTLTDVVSSLRGRTHLARADISHTVPSRVVRGEFAHIRGHTNAKRALEIAAIGGHTMLLMGPPGSGKTLLANALASILPKLSEAEVLAATQIHSLAGVLPAELPIVTDPPFRQPHHRSTVAAIVGGANPPRPGEISLAHHGILFLDELPLFETSVLDALREPLEEGWIHISRARGSVRFPARPLLVAAMNLCPCGPTPNGCHCDARARSHYQGRLSGPLLDRIDMLVPVARQDASTLVRSTVAERSETILGRVARARAFRTTRGQECLNAHLTLGELSTACPLTSEGRRLLRSVAEQLRLSARGIHRTLRVARSIADLAHEAQIGPEHLAEALQFRAGSTPWSSTVPPRSIPSRAVAPPASSST